MPTLIGNKAKLVVLNKELSQTDFQSYRLVLILLDFNVDVLLMIIYRNIKKNLLTLVQVFCKGQYDVLNFRENLRLIDLSRVFEIISKVSVSSQNSSNAYILVENSNILKDFKTASRYRNLEKISQSTQEIIVKRVFDMMISVIGFCEKIKLDNIRLAILFTKFIGYDFDSVEMSIQFSPHEIRFISCGDTFADRRSYFVLLASFDSNCWILILLVLFICVPTIWIHILKYGCNKSYPNIVEVMIAIFKNLTEQSTSFPENVFLREKMSMRLVASGLLLALLVLSNAYKNNNINVLISPVPF